MAGTGHITRESLVRAVERAEGRVAAAIPGDEKQALIILKTMRTRLANHEDRSEK